MKIKNLLKKAGKSLMAGIFAFNSAGALNSITVSAQGNTFEDVAAKKWDGQAIVNEAKRHLGIPYTMVGTPYYNGYTGKAVDWDYAQHGLDCSGFVTLVVSSVYPEYGRQIVSSIGVPLSDGTMPNANLIGTQWWHDVLSNVYPVRVERLAWNNADTYSIIKNNAAVGDILMWYSGNENAQAGTSMHIGFYAGDGKVVHCSDNPGHSAVTDLEKTVKHGAMVSVALYHMSEEKTGNLTLTKEDSQTGTKAQGLGKLDKVSYEVKNKENGKKVGTITWENGKANTLKDLEAGTYVLTETQSATGYHKGTFSNGKLQSSFEVKVNPGETTTFNAKDRVSEIKINKVDEETGKPVKGATLKLLDADSKKEVTFNNGKTEWVTDGSTLTVKGLTVGKSYILREEKTPSGYSTAKDITFKVDENTEVQTITMKNRLTEIKINKVNPKGEPVKGAHLVLLDADTMKKVAFNKEGDDPKEWITNGESLTIRGLPVGKEYILQEIKAPTGYSLADDIKFAVEDRLDAQIVSMIDEPSKPVEPIIGTQATIDGEKTIKEKGKVELVDVVSYENVKAGQEYTLKGQLMDKETKEPLAIEGATVEKTFTPDKSKGTVEVVFSIDSSEIAGKDTVVFETLYKDGKEVVAHADIEDKGQTVRVEKEVKIGTTASIDGSKAIVPSGEVTLNDVVKYEKVTEGKKYIVEGVLMDKDTRTELTLNGETFTNSVEFTAEKENGEITVPFIINSDYLAGKTIVVFEKLYEVNEDGSKTEVTKHEDFNDKGQTVEIISNHELKTTATVNGKHEAVATEKVELIDVVEYKDLRVGQEYTMKGQLMDKETGKAIEGVTSEVKFTPKKASGTVEMKFVFDGSKVAEKKTVVFEELYDVQGRLVGEHKDIKDKDQSVEFIVEIGTQAKINGEKEVVTNGKMNIVDTISYKGLTPGKEYTAKGVLMDKSTGKELEIEGAKAEVKFTPEKSEGTVDVTFTIDTSKVAGKSIVVFEEVYNKEGKKVAEHKDINDQDQTVVVKQPQPTTPAPSTPVKTGVAIGSVSALGLAGAAYFVSKKTKE